MTAGWTPSALGGGVHAGRAAVVASVAAGRGPVLTGRTGAEPCRILDSVLGGDAGGTG